MSLPVSVRESYINEVVTERFSNSPLQTYHINRFGELEIDYGQLELAFQEKYGQAVGTLLFDYICDDPVVDIEQQASANEAELYESMREDLSHMNHALYAKTA